MALGWQGVEATAAAITVGDRDIGARLLVEAASRSCNLVVMGGYGHSRVREFVLGGVTRHVLHNARIPLLMSH